MSVDDSYSEWCLGRLAQRIREGWIYVDISPNDRCLIRPDRDCDISSCPQHGTVHRHQPTLADREQAYDCITDWLAVEFRREEERKAITELKRIYALEDPRPSTPSDLRAEAQRLICTGKMPSLDELLNTLEKTSSPNLLGPIRRSPSSKNLVPSAAFEIPGTAAESGTMAGRN